MHIYQATPLCTSKSTVQLPHLFCLLPVRSWSWYNFEFHIFYVSPIVDAPVTYRLLLSLQIVACFVVSGSLLSLFFLFCSSYSYTIFPLFSSSLVLVIRSPLRSVLASLRSRYVPFSVRPDFPLFPPVRSVTSWLAQAHHIFTDHLVCLITGSILSLLFFHITVSSNCSILQFVWSFCHLSRLWMISHL